MRYMYYLLAESKTRNDTFPDMRDYCERNNYAVFKREQPLTNRNCLPTFGTKLPHAATDFRRELEFTDFKQLEKFLRERLRQTRFSNQRAITGAMTAWRTFSDEKQDLPPPDVKLEQEHIYAKKRHELNPKELSNPDLLETLGN